jgi:hypothetical protein
MNYIKSLQNKVKELELELNNKKEKINDFVSFLHCNKFVGFESNGARKDWIATGDVLHKLIEIRDCHEC